jgi:hypothetical protein
MSDEVQGRDIKFVVVNEGLERLELMSSWTQRSESARTPRSYRRGSARRRRLCNSTTRGVPLLEGAANADELPPCETMVNSSVRSPQISS